jgi:hypothetical protein
MERDPDQPDVQPEPTESTKLLDAIPGAFARAQLGLDQALRGVTVPLDEL